MTTRNTNRKTPTYTTIICHSPEEVVKACRKTKPWLTEPNTVTYGQDSNGKVCEVGLHEGFVLKVGTHWMKFDVSRFDHDTYIGMESYTNPSFAGHNEWVRCGGVPPTYREMTVAEVEAVWKHGVTISVEA